MIFAFLKIRLTQLYRLYFYLGLFRTLLIGVLLALVLYIAKSFLSNSQNNIYISIGCVLFLATIHVTRKDKHFLKSLIPFPYMIYFMEYLMLMLPILTLCVFGLNLKGAILIILVTVLFPTISLQNKIGASSSILKFLINPFSTSLNFKLNIPLPIKNPYAFEWISGLRANLPYLGPLYIIILVFAYKGYVAPIGSLLLTLFISTFYYYGEPREFIELYAKKPKAFLLKKIQIAIRLQTVILIPLIGINVIAQPENWYFMVGALILSYLILFISIIFKYALYNENSDLSRNSMIVLLNIICLLLPFLWPLPIVMGIRYTLKAKNKLKPYFDDNRS